MKKIILLIVLLTVYSSYSEVKNGLVAHWTFDSDSLVIADESDNGLAGKAQNISLEKGIIGNSAKFDSQNDRIIISDTVNKLPERIAGLRGGAISIWFKFQNVGGQVLPLFYYGESSKGQPQNSLIIEIGHNEDSKNRRLYFTIVNKKFCFDTKINLEPNKWYHFVAVVGNNGNTGWLNGEELTDRNYNLGSDSTYKDFFSSVTTNELCSIGYGRYGLNDNFLTYKGWIDDLRIYDRPLEPEEIVELYQMGNIQDENKPTFENVEYGSYERNVLDFWKAVSEEPTPLVIFIHGGGFTSGDKTQARSGTNLNYLQRCLAAKVSYAAINYRFKQTTRLDTIMLDVARALQFIRYKADEWNIDKNRIASYGGSAGGGATIWLAFGDDKADPSNADPILRESTRLTVAGHLNSQSTYDFLRWASIIGLPEDWYEQMKLTDDVTLYHIPDRTWYDSLEIIMLRKKLDMVDMIDKKDPPVYFQCLNPNITPTTSGSVIHHPKHAIFLKNIYDSLNIDNAIVLAETPVEERVDLLDFFFKYLLPTSKVDEISSNSLYISPNPASDYIEINLDKVILSEAKNPVKIYNTFGECVIDLTPTPLLTGEGLRIDISHLHVGIYFIQIGNYTEKFMVVR
jgi:hypothetical protein